MRRRSRILGLGLLALAACAAPVEEPTVTPTGFLLELPPQVALLAAPYQNLQEVMLLPEDNCFWYRHVGPVETTMLPLLTADGRPICQQAEEVPAAG